MADCKTECEFPPLDKVIPTATDNCICVNVNGGGGGTGDGITSITGADPYIDVTTNGRAAQIGVQRIADMQYNPTTNILSGVEVGADGTETPFSYNLASGSSALQIVDVNPTTGLWSMQIQQNTPVLLNIPEEAVSRYNEVLSENIVVTGYWGIAVRTGPATYIAQVLPAYLDPDEEYMNVSLRWTNDTTFIPSIPTEVYHTQPSGAGDVFDLPAYQLVQTGPSSVGWANLRTNALENPPQDEPVFIRINMALIPRWNVTPTGNGASELTYGYMDGIVLFSSTSGTLNTTYTSTGVTPGSYNLVFENLSRTSSVPQAVVINKVYPESSEPEHTDRVARLWKGGTSLLVDWDGTDFIFYGGVVDIQTAYAHYTATSVPGILTRFVEGAYLGVNLQNPERPSIAVYNTLDDIYAADEVYNFARMQTTNNGQTAFIEGFGTLPLPPSNTPPTGGSGGGGMVGAEESGE